MPEKSLFTTNDILGNKIICSEQIWNNHIISQHPIMKKNLFAVKDTIENPDFIFNSTSPERQVYFKQSTLSTYKNLYTKVITENTIINTKKVVTAFPQKEVKGGIGDEIYSKKQSKL